MIYHYLSLCGRLRRSQASRLHFAIEPVVGVLPMDLDQPLLKPILFLSPVVVGGKGGGRRS
jgi:hypothetical protein